MTRMHIIEYWKNLFNKNKENPNDCDSSMINIIHIYTDYKVIYIKYPKNGGSTIFRKIIEPQTTRDSKNYIHARVKPNEFQEWLDNMTESLLDKYFIFTIVRNPLFIT